MFYFIPTRTQWRGWSLPSKLTCISAYLGALSVLLSIAFYIWPAVNPWTEQKGSLTPSVATVAPEQSRLGHDQIRAQLSSAMRDGEVERALAILASIGDSGLKREECERVYSFCIKNRRLRDARAVVDQCWDGSRRHQALADIEREQLKGQ